MQQHDFLRGRFAAGATFALFYFQVCIGASPAVADEIVLRDLTIITGKTVSHFDPDGVRFEDGSVITWDRIEQGTIAAEKQAGFDRRLNELGARLYSIRRRLRSEDYQDLLPHSRDLYPLYRDRRSSTSYMVMQATMWAHLARGQREQALAPYLRCLEISRSSAASAVDDLPGDRRLQFDRQTGLTPELMPIWFDATAAKQQLDRVFKAIQAMRRPRPQGVLIYYVTLALAAGELEKADQVLAAVTADSGPVAELKAIVTAQRAIAGGDDVPESKLASRLDQLSDLTRPLACYWAGIAQLSPDRERVDRQRGLLLLLQVPALYGEQQPDVSAAALYRVASELETLDDARGSAAVRADLLERFGKTHFATLVRSAAGRSDGG